MNNTLYHCFFQWYCFVIYALNDVNVSCLVFSVKINEGYTSKVLHWSGNSMKRWRPG